jgi:hypothetical protein
MRKIGLVFVVALLAIAVSVGAAAASQSRTSFQTLLGPEGVVVSDAHGNAVVVMTDDNSQLSYKLVVNGLEDTLQSHIHVAPAPGQNGPVVLFLYPDGPPAQLFPGIFNGLLGSRTVTSADIRPKYPGISNLDDLRQAIEEGRAYVNVHSVENPGGEIRGTLH